MPRMRVLIACEFSGVVRRAFRALGHDAWSCDLLPAEDGSEFHIVGDALAAIAHGCPTPTTYGKPWDLLIAHPPCTYLCNSGVRWLYVNGRGKQRCAERWYLMVEACRFFAAMLESGIPRICVENPIMHRFARHRIGHRHSQIIQPWMFGHPETKATCLWLRGLPLLKPTNIVSGRTPRVHHASPGPDRWKERSRTMSGIAAAMAEQWGNL